SFAGSSCNHIGKAARVRLRRSTPRPSRTLLARTDALWLPLQLAMVIGLPSIHSPLLPHNEASSTSRHDHNVPGRDMFKSLSRVWMERAVTSERQTVSLGVLGMLVL